jgi:hypothetical protein
MSDTVGQANQENDLAKRSPGQVSDIADQGARNKDAEL